ncbi:MAG: hypothetical protein M9938_06000 [Solirubrobacterales bacterium]|nr:hypothetical protein [Solirubrobacterales bacterium]
MRRTLTTVTLVAAALVLGVVALTVFGNRGDDSRGRSTGQTPPASAAQSGATGESAWPEDPLAGLNLTAYTRDGYGRPEVKTDIERIVALDATAITLTPTWYMATGSSDSIRPDPKKSPSDTSLNQAINWIREAGLKVILKPHVDVLDGTFRGDIQPTDRDRWFSSYTEFIRHYTSIAASQQVELFAVGTELKSLSGDPTPWRSVIEEVRSEFPGKLTYAANWDEVGQVQFWDQLDLIGVDAYFPLAEGNPEPDEAALAAAWQPVVDSLRGISEQWDRPVLLTEVGYPSQKGATEHPWEVRPDQPADVELQARATRAVFQAFGDQPWLAGINWWSWRADPSDQENHGIDYTPEDKPAEQVLRDAWGSSSG